MYLDKLMKILNIVYCLDSKYNIQFITSAYSLLQKISEPVNLIVLHQDPSSLKSLIKLIEGHKNCNNFSIIKINDENINFPNLNSSHVSKATYYRLFIPQYLKDKDFVIYLDSDTVVLQDPASEFRKIIKEFKNKYYIAGTLETNRDETPDIFDRLDLNGEEYFNAGVLIFNIKKILENFSETALLENMHSIQSKIKMWDQDVLNHFFDKKWFKFDRKFNFLIDLSKTLSEINSSTYIIHYVGSKKPWTFEGIQKKNSIYYQQSFMNALKVDYFHFTTSWRKKSLKQFIIFASNFRNYQNENFLTIAKSFFYIQKTK